jgi:uncharacterized protein (TIGR02118 family)
MNRAFALIGFWAIRSVAESIVEAMAVHRNVVLPGAEMTAVKLIVQYPRPKDVDAFEKVYQSEHVPMAIAKLAGKTKIVASKIVASPQGAPAFYRIAEIHFPSRQALDACAASEGGKQTIANAASISSGGRPTFLIAEEETLTFS